MQSNEKGFPEYAAIAVIVCVCTAVAVVVVTMVSALLKMSGTPQVANNTPRVISAQVQAKKLKPTCQNEHCKGGYAVKIGDDWLFYYFWFNNTAYTDPSTIYTTYISTSGRATLPPGGSWTRSQNAPKEEEIEEEANAEETTLEVPEQLDLEIPQETVGENPAEASAAVEGQSTAESVTSPVIDTSSVTAPDTSSPSSDSSGSSDSGSSDSGGGGGD